MADNSEQSSIGTTKVNELLKNKTNKISIDDMQDTTNNSNAQFGIKGQTVPTNGFRHKQPVWVIGTEGKDPKKPARYLDKVAKNSAFGPGPGTQQTKDKWGTGIKGTWKESKGRKTQCDDIISQNNKFKIPGPSNYTPKVQQEKFIPTQKWDKAKDINFLTNSEFQGKIRQDPGKYDGKINFIKPKVSACQQYIKLNKKSESKKESIGPGSQDYHSQKLRWLPKSRSTFLCSEKREPQYVKEGKSKLKFPGVGAYDIRKGENKITKGICISPMARSLAGRIR